MGMNQDIQKLPKELRKNGYTYVLAARSESGTEAIYYQMDGERMVGFEVGRIKKVSAATVFGKDYPEREVFWSNEDFGQIAWFTTTAQKAYDIMRQIQNGERIKEQNGRVI